MELIDDEEEIIEITFDAYNLSMHAYLYILGITKGKLRSKRSCRHRTIIQGFLIWYPDP